MRKSIWIFLLAVILPSVVLGWLALGSAEEQKIILERRTAELYQKEADNAAAAARLAVEEERRAFTEAVRKLLASGDPNALAKDFTQRLPQFWPRQAVGFVLGADGQMLSPAPESTKRDPALSSFIVDNGAFLSGSLPATVYQVPVEELNWIEPARRSKTGALANANASRGYARGGEMDKLAKAGPETASAQRQYGVRSELAIVPEPAPAAAPAPAPGSPNSPKEKEIQAALDVKDEDKSLPANGMDDSRSRASSIADSRDQGQPVIRESKLVTKGDPAPAAPSMPAEALSSAPEAASKSRVPAPGILNEATPNGLTRGAAQGVLQGDMAKKDAPPPAPATGFKSSAAAKPQATVPPSKEAPPASRAQGGKDAEGMRRDLSGYTGQALTGKAEDVPMDKLEAEQGESKSAQLRSVAPQQTAAVPVQPPPSNLSWATTEFSSLVSQSDEGMVTRFVQDQLDMIFWMRPAQAPHLVFGCLIKASSLKEVWAATLPGPDEQEDAAYSIDWRRGASSGPGSEFILALLDDKAQPVAVQPAGLKSADWKRPFVAAEIGEALPHWEAALYLRDPAQLQRSALSVQRTLLLLIVSMLSAIACGGWLVVHDARRQMLLAQQKTDFVSNVSHELKTPLTSIRMFAELMQGGRPETAAKAPQYLRIIMVEAERLTRLINNVLDFAKMERRQKRLNKRPIDFHEVIERTWEAHELHLQGSGFSTKATIAPGPYPVLADDDALAQILVNLLSNAEKYSGERKEVELQAWLDGGSAWVSILDRGLGVAPGEEKKIFEAFYRAHDSLSSGIQGSGLGLTLAQRLARDHDGEILHETRQDGGSRFTLRIPLQPSQAHEGAPPLVP